MKTLLLILCAGLMLTGCGQTDVNKETSDVQEEGQVTIANPFHDFDTLEEACASSGLQMNLPSTIGKYTMSIYRSIPEELLEIIYLNGEDDMLKVRKSLGEEDNSGNFDAETYETTVYDHGDLKLNVSSKDDLIYVAYWIADGESYSMTADTGISMDDLLMLVDTINE